MLSMPANAPTRARSVDFGRWKLVIMASMILNSNPGVMKSLVQPLLAISWPLAPAVSSVRTLVVPTATIRRLCGHWENYENRAAEWAVR